MPRPPPVLVTVAQPLPAPAMPPAPLWLPPERPLQPACGYIPDPSDPVDVALAQHLASLDARALSRLSLRRFGLGFYEIEGQCVCLRWDSVHGDRELELCVWEQGLGIEGAARVSLRAYLWQAASLSLLKARQRAHSESTARLQGELFRAMSATSSRPSSRGPPPCSAHAAPRPPAPMHAAPEGLAAQPTPRSEPAAVPVASVAPAPTIPQMTEAPQVAASAPVPTRAEPVAATVPVPTSVPMLPAAFRHGAAILMAVEPSGHPVALVPVPPQLSVGPMTRRVRPSMVGPAAAPPATPRRSVTPALASGARASSRPPSAARRDSSSQRPRQLLSL